MTTREYLQLRRTLWGLGHREEYDWAQTVKPPTSPEQLWREYAWVVLNSGMKNQVAQRIWERVRPQVEETGSMLGGTFNHVPKRTAIEDGWRDREARFFQFRYRLTTHGIQSPAIVEWCAGLPWIGPTTRWHLAKNLGAEVCKPDRWLVRVAGVTRETPEQLCRRLGRATGDRIATVDLVVWRACNLGLWVEPRSQADLKVGDLGDGTPFIEPDLEGWVKR